MLGTGVLLPFVFAVLVEEHSSLLSPNSIFDLPSGNPAQSEEFECPRYWSNFRFNRKDIMASMAAAPGWN